MQSGISRTGPVGRIAFEACSVMLGFATALLLPLLVNTQTEIYLGDRIVDAVNCGGKAHTDANGIRYRADDLRVGTASDFGSRYMIARVRNEQDMVLYQTERYHTETFSYEVRFPTTGDGEDSYVLVMKFCEVYFTAPQQKVFSVVLNGQLKVVDDLDIFAKAGGRAAAFDVAIPFRLADGKLLIGDEDQYSATISDRTLTISFVKGPADNPKINAFYVLRGTIDQVPLLPALEPVAPKGHDEDVIDEEDEEMEHRQRAERDHNHHQQDQQDREGGTFIC